MASATQQSTHAPSRYPPPAARPARLVVLVSGSGTNLQALLDAAADPAYGATVVAVGADRDGILALKRAEDAAVPTFVCRLKDHPDRASWDRALRDEVRRHEPDLVVSAGFMKLVGPDFLAAFGGRMINTHPALLPAFPGMHGARDAISYGVKITGCTLFVVAAGVDDGPIVAQAAVPVVNGDDEHSLHERIKVAERQLLVEQVGRMAREGWTITQAPVPPPPAVSGQSPESSGPGPASSSSSTTTTAALGSPDPVVNRKVTIP